MFFDSGTIYRHVSESFEMRQEQVENVTDKTNVPFTLSFSSHLMLLQRECKPALKYSDTSSKVCLKHTQIFLGFFQHFFVTYCNRDQMALKLPTHHIPFDPTLPP